MLKALAFAALTPVVIKAVSDGYEWICECFGTESKPVPKKKVRRKVKSDTTVITHHMKVRIHAEYRNYIKYKKTVGGLDMKSLQALTVYLNKELGLRKSRSAYSRIWNKK